MKTLLISVLLVATTGCAAHWYDGVDDGDDPTAAYLLLRQQPRHLQFYPTQLRPRIDINVYDNRPFRRY